MTDTNQPPQREPTDGRDAVADRGDRSRNSSSTVSRRNLLVATATGAAGLAAVPTGVGGSRTGSKVAAGVVVDGAESHRELSAGVAGRVRRDHPDADLTVRGSGTAEGFRRFAAGDVDAHVASRPMLPAERDRAADRGVAYERVELALGGATLAYSGNEWYECLRDHEVADRWAGDGEVATYAEVAERAADAEARKQTLDSDRAAVAPDDDATVLVRGTRAFQYERGFGGVAYYEPDVAGVRSRGDGGRDADGAELLRLAYLYLNRTSLERPAVESFRRAYLDRTARLTGDVTYFADPRT